MKRHLQIICAVSLAVLASSCTEEISDLQKDAFIKFYGSYLGDVGRDVQSMGTEGYAVTGTVVPDSVARMVLILTDEAGNQKEGSPIVYGGDYQTAGNALLLLGDGFLLGGTLTDTTADDEFETDIFLVRTNEVGDTIWTRRFGGEENDVLNHVVQRHSGGFVIAGKKTTDEDENLWILMVDEAGQLIYDLEGSDLDDDDEANFIYRTADGYICACTYDDGTMEGTDIYLISLDENCNVLDARAFGDEDDNFARSVVRIGNDYYVMGYTESTVTGLDETRLFRFSVESGEITAPGHSATIWANGADIKGEDCILNSEGNIVVFGTTTVNENRDMYLVVLDSEGALIGDPREYGELGNQSGFAVDAAPDGGLILVGTSSLEGNSLISLMKTDANGRFN